ncbi:MAG: response regulator transcription factor [Tissierellia bacterium]|nr:response regulator transcription factor [Tissierellia bacterium]
MLKIYLCDDEDFFLDEIKKLILAFGKNKNIDIDVEAFKSGQDLISAYGKDEEVDAVFLDVDMPDMDGLETAKSLRDMAYESAIVFITQFISYALEGYRVRAVRYILKSDTQFEDSLNEALTYIINEKTRLEKRIELPFTDGKRFIYLSKITYIESRLHNLIFHLEDGSELNMRGKLSSLEADFKDHYFLRIHQSYLVNLAFVDSISYCSLKLKNGDELPIPKARYRDVKDMYLKYKGEVL